ncbi:MAG: pimeloyl-ACP methyl ester carboxylesterase [Candidatus Azotimanducaceae bacterium]|jgi:pimeloyl-ACP methyl ester carboxylesterase
METRHLDGIKAREVKTARLKQHVIQSGAPDGIPVVFIHGNFSSSCYFEELMLEMPSVYRCIAVDLRGYGDTEPALIDATRGARDWSDDLASLLEALAIEKAHFVAWSIGAAAAMQLAIDYPEVVQSMTLAAPVSPFGYGGTRDVEGACCHADYAGSGGGMVGTEFIERVQARDRGRSNPASPLNVIYGTYFHDLTHLEREDDLLNGSLKQSMGDQQYPGDGRPSDNWPFAAPGDFGPINAISPKYFVVAELVDIDNKPPVLWVRGDKDAIISNRSASDIGVLGEAGLIPDWPGSERYPPQPMVDQMRFLLDRYQDKGGKYKEVVLEGVGHSPFIEVQELFLEHLLEHLVSFDDIAD